jgi:pyruvate kinase
MKLTKIVCTLGPVTASKKILSDLIDAGMNVARLNCSHGDHEDKREKIQILRQLMDEKSVRVGLLLDNKWPEIRTWKLVDGKEVFLETGKKIIMTTEEILGDANKFYVDYKNITKDLKKGDTVLIDDGLIGLRVDSIKKNEVHCTVMNTGYMGERKWINLPNVQVKLPSLVQKDIDDIIFGCKQKVDYYALSFTRNKKDVLAARKVFDENGGEHIKIIAKIENQEGIDNFDQILEVVDGIMIARGDMGVEIPIRHIPLIQKMMIKKCNAANKVVITATEMLDSMIRNPRPTRAEVTDIANAILDGTDAVMLSGETAKGKYPVQAVTMMANVCTTVDTHVVISELSKHISGDTTEAIAKWAVAVAQEINATCIVLISAGGKTARLVRKYNPQQPLVILTPHDETAGQCMCVRGCYAYKIKPIPRYEDLNTVVQTLLKKNKFAKKWDMIVLTTSESLGKHGTTDMLKVIEVE